MCARVHTCFSFSQFFPLSAFSQLNTKCYHNKKQNNVIWDLEMDESSNVSGRDSLILSLSALILYNMHKRLWLEIHEGFNGAVLLSVCSAPTNRTFPAPTQVRPWSRDSETAAAPSGLARSLSRATRRHRKPKCTTPSSLPMCTEEKCCLCTPSSVSNRRLSIWTGDCFTAFTCL